MPQRLSRKELKYMMDFEGDPYMDGYRRGFKDAMEDYQVMLGEADSPREVRRVQRLKPKRKRKLSAWNKYVKANSKKPRFRYRNGKLNLKKMAIAFRKTPAGRKKKRR